MKYGLRMSLALLASGSLFGIGEINWIEEIRNNYGEDVYVASTDTVRQGYPKGDQPDIEIKRDKKIAFEVGPTAATDEGYKGGEELGRYETRTTNVLKIKENGDGRVEQLAIPWAKPGQWILVYKKSPSSDSDDPTKPLLKFRETSTGWALYKQALENAASIGGGLMGVFLINPAIGSAVAAGTAIGLMAGASAIQHNIVKHIQVFNGDNKQIADFILCQGRDCSAGFSLNIPDEDFLKKLPELQEKIAEKYQQQLKVSADILAKKMNLAVLNPLGMVSGGAVEVSPEVGLLQRAITELEEESKDIADDLEKLNAQLKPLQTMFVPWKY